MPPYNSVLDRLVDSNACFALYRTPGCPPTLLLQLEGKPKCLDAPADLNGKQGFVMAPFVVSGHHPIVLIRPDRTLIGEAALKEGLEPLLESLPSRRTQGRISPEDLPQDPKRVSNDYTEAFELFHKALMAGSCDKIVLSRTLQKALPDSFSVGTLFQTACERYPEAFVYVCHTEFTGTWLGISPEILLCGKGGHFQTVALAGTQKIRQKRVTWDAKNIREQGIVSDYLEKELRIHDLNATRSEPYSVQAGHLMHRRTDFHFELPDGDRLGDLLQALHPTPAVCGYPKEEAFRLIQAHEGYDRAYYSGFVGPLDPAADTNVFVNLRCAQLGTNSVMLYAGGGLMPDSERNAEWEETETKLQTLLSLMTYQP